MARRKIITINEVLCNGCGVCIPNCPEGAIQIIDGKARLISDLLCDGLGACIGHCPQGAITIEERQAQEYDERRVMGNMVKQGANVIKAHLRHLKEHGQMVYYRQAMDFLSQNNIQVNIEEADPFPRGCHGAGAAAEGGGCPGARMRDFRVGKQSAPAAEARPVSASSELRQWPVQLMLVPAHAPYLNDADVLIAADCVPFAYAAFHNDLLKGKALLVGCPKLDDTGIYRQKLSQILQHNTVRSITYAHMEVPCCFGLVSIIREAIVGSGKDVPFHEVTISIRGEKL